MSGRIYSYQFETAEQWGACLLAGAAFVPAGSKASLRPFAAFAPQANPEFPTGPAWAPARTWAEEWLWRDASGRLHRLADGDEAPRSVAVPTPIDRASRIIASGDGLWVAGRARGTVECFDLETLSRRFVAEIPDHTVVDLAGDDRQGIRVLVTDGGNWRVVRVDCAGNPHLEEAVRLECDSPPVAFTFLRRPARIVALSRGGEELCAFPGEGGRPDARLPTATLGDCFKACQIASDPHGRVWVAGSNGSGASPHRLMALDAHLVRILEVGLAEAATSLAATRTALLVTGQRGLYVLRASDTVPDSVPEIEARAVTPMLEGPDPEDGRRWLRIEATASLPAGSSLEIAYAAPDDQGIEEELLAIERDASVARGQRARLLTKVAGAWSTPMVFHGSEALGRESGGAPLAVPLHDAGGRHLWVAATIRAGTGAETPALSRLRVLYPGRSLMEHLPSIYRREEAQPRSFTRGLVGILETTTQDLDARIAEMGRSIHPEHAPGPWLDYLARWLGLPWDDALGLKQKRCLVTHAAALAANRGTRVGLEALLACLIPGPPRRFRVTDVTVDFGFAMVGDGTCEGSSLPALLSGSTRPDALLGSRAVVGAMTLPCPGEAEDDSSPLVGRIRIDVAASAEERLAWEPWLLRLIVEMVPMTAAPEIRWVTPGVLAADRLDDDLVLEGPPHPHLGTDAVTGQARLPEGTARLSDSGPTAGTRLN